MNIPKFLLGFFLFFAWFLSPFLFAQSSLPVSSALQKEKGLVFLSLPEFHQLTRNKNKKWNPSNLSISGYYAGKATKKKLSFRCKIKVLVHRKNILFHLGGQKGLIQEIQVNQQARVATLYANGSYWLPLEKGTHEIEYTYTTAVSGKNGDHQQSLHFPAIPSAVLEIEFQGQDWEVSTQPASFEKIKILPKGKLFSFLLPSTGNIRLSWKGKRIQRKIQSRFRSQVETFVSLKDNLLSGNSDIEIKLLTGSKRTLLFTLSQEVEILYVKGKSVTEWYQTKIANGFRHVQVHFSHAIDTTATFKVTYERNKIPTNQPILLPQLHVPNAEQKLAYVGVLAKADTEVSLHQISNARQMDVRFLPESFRKKSESPILLAYQYEDENHKAEVNILEHEKVSVLSILAESATYYTVVTSDGREMMQINYQLKNNQKQFMELVISKDTEILGAMVANESVQPALSQKQPNPKEKLILLPLIRSNKNRSQETFAVQLFLSRKRQDMKSYGKKTFILPKTPIQVLSFSWTLYLPKSHRVIEVDGNVRNTYERDFFQKLERRINEDLSSRIPSVWAGGFTKKHKLNRYMRKGLRTRFLEQSLMGGSGGTAGKWGGLGSFGSSMLQNAPSSNSDYRNREYPKKQLYQNKIEFPFVGKAYSFQGKLFKNKHPQLEIYTVREKLLTRWFWISFVFCFLIGFLVCAGLFFKSDVQWSKVVLGIFLALPISIAGYFLPYTFLGLVSGGLWGLWFGLSIRLSIQDRQEFRFQGIVSTWLRWWFAFLTFVMLFNPLLLTQITCFILAFPCFLILLRKRVKTTQNIATTVGENK